MKTKEGINTVLIDEVLVEYNKAVKVVDFWKQSLIKRLEEEELKALGGVSFRKLTMGLEGNQQHPTNADLSVSFYGGIIMVKYKLDGITLIVSVRHDRPNFFKVEGEYKTRSAGWFCTPKKYESFAEEAKEYAKTFLIEDPLKDYRDDLQRRNVHLF